MLIAPKKASKTDDPTSIDECGAVAPAWTFDFTHRDVFIWADVTETSHQHSIINTVQSWRMVEILET
jgi:hypothetical protein